MTARHAHRTVNAARALRSRHPDASTAEALVGLVMATYADGPTGARIFPGLDNVVSDTGLDRRTVQRAINRLQERGEMRLDKKGRRGSAACFTWTGGMDGPEPEPETPAAPAAPAGHVCTEWGDWDRCVECGAYRYDVRERSYA